jgi:hypothetical protein
MERGKKQLEKLRRRREAAVKLFEQGARQATVAHSLRASRQSVSEWWLAWRAGDTKKAQGRHGSRAKASRAAGATEACGEGAHSWSARPWVRNGPVVPAEDCEAHQEADRGELSPRSCVEDPAAYGLEPAATCRAGPRARRTEGPQWKSQTREEVKKELEPGAHG